MHNDNTFRRAWALQIGFADGYGTFRDMGTAPLSFDGLLLQHNLGLHFIFPQRMEFSIVSQSALGIFEDAIEPTLNFSTFDIHNTTRLKFIKALKKNNSTTLQLYWGAAMTNFLDVTVNQNYENAAAGVSDFFGPEAVGRIDLKLRQESPLLFHGEVALMPVAAVLRPGYSYIDNYTATHPVIDALFTDFDVSIKPFASISTDLGIDIITGPASRISFSYLWSYHTSGNSGHHRFDHATHMLAIDFLVKLRTKQ